MEAGILEVEVVRRSKTKFRACGTTLYLKTYWVPLTSDTVSHLTLSATHNKQHSVPPYATTETQPEDLSCPRPLTSEQLSWDSNAGQPE